MARQVIEARHPGKARHLLSVLACCGAIPLPGGGAAASAASRQQRLAAQAHWCRHYARVNAMGLRKIVKKYDKLLGSNTGSRFLQVGTLDGPSGDNTPTARPSGIACSIV